MESLFNLQEIIDMINKTKVSNRHDVYALCVSEPSKQIQIILQSLGVECAIVPNCFASILDKDIIYIIPKYVIN